MLKRYEDQMFDREVLFRLRNQAKEDPEFAKRHNIYTTFFDFLTDKWIEKITRELSFDNSIMKMNALQGCGSSISVNNRDSYGYPGEFEDDLAWLYCQHNIMPLDLKSEGIIIPAQNIPLTMDEIMRQHEKVLDYYIRIGYSDIPGWDCHVNAYPY